MTDSEMCCGGGGGGGACVLGMCVSYSSDLGWWCSQPESASVIQRVCLAQGL